MPKADPILQKLRNICLSLPDTEETPTWGQPHFRVRGKIFAGYGEEKGKVAMGFKLPMELADLVVQEPHFSRAPYVGKHGWVSLEAAGATNWRRIEAMIHESYRLIAPKRSLAKLDGESGPGDGKRAGTGRRASGKKAAASTKAGKKRR